MRFLLKILVIFFLLPIPLIYGANWDSPYGGHLGAWKVMWQLDLNKGGLEKKLPNPITKVNQEKLREIHDFIDCNDGKHKGSGPSKRNGITHNPFYVATYFNISHGYNWQAVFNATVIHLILDMATGESDGGVNGNKNIPQYKQQAEELWDDMIKGKGIKSPPKWATKTGKNLDYNPNEVKKAAELKAKDGLSAAKNNKNINTIPKQNKLSNKTFKKVVKPVQYAVVVYETGKVVKKYIDTGEVDLEKSAEGVARMAGGWAGAEAGVAIGCAACAPAITTGPGYVVCVGIFTIGGAVLGDEAAGRTSQFIIENKEVIEERIYSAYKIGKTFSDSIVNYDIFKDNKYADMAFEKRQKAIALRIEGKEQESAEVIGDAYFYLGYALYEKGLRYRTEYVGKIVNLITDESDQCFNFSRDFFRNSIKCSPENSMTYYLLADSNLMLKNYTEARSYYNKSIYYFKKDNRPKWEEKARKMVQFIDENILL